MSYGSLALEVKERIFQYLVTPSWAWRGTKPMLRLRLVNREFDFVLSRELLRKLLACKHIPRRLLHQPTLVWLLATKLGLGYEHSGTLTMLDARIGVLVMLLWQCESMQAEVRATAQAAAGPYNRLADWGEWDEDAYRKIQPTWSEATVLHGVLATMVAFQGVEWAVLQLCERNTMRCKPLLGTREERVRWAESEIEAEEAQDRDMVAAGVDPDDTVALTDGVRKLRELGTMPVCAFLGEIDMVAALLATGLSAQTGKSIAERINLANPPFGPPLYAAVCGGQMPCVALLLRHGADPMLRAHRRDSLRSVPRSIARVTPIVAAARKGDVNVLRQLLLERMEGQAQNKRRTQKGRQARGVMWTQLRDEFSVVPPLRTALSPNHAMTLASGLWAAAARDDTAAVHLLLAAGGDMNTVLPSRPHPVPLVLATAYRGHRRTVRLLCEQPALRVNKWDVRGHSLLMVAAERGWLDVVQVLLERTSAHVNRASEYGWTALHLACRLGLRDVVAALLADWSVSVNRLGRDVDGSRWTEADKERMNYDGQARGTPLAVALRWQRRTIAEMLLAHPAVDAGAAPRDHPEAAPLVVAVDTGWLAMVDRLLARDDVLRARGFRQALREALMLALSRDDTVLADRLVAAAGTTLSAVLNGRSVQTRNGMHQLDEGHGMHEFHFHNGQNLHSDEPDGQSPFGCYLLHRVIVAGGDRGLAHLLATGAVNTQTVCHRQTALMAAVRSGNEAAVRQLLSRPDAQVNWLAQGTVVATALGAVLRPTSFRERVQRRIAALLLARADIDPNASAPGPLNHILPVLHQEAAAGPDGDGDVDMPDADNADPDVDSDTNAEIENILSLIEAVPYHPPPPHFLPPPATPTPPSVPSYFFDPEITRLQPCPPPLVVAVMTHRLWFAKLLLQHPSIQPNAAGSDGRTAVWWAVFSYRKAHALNVLLAHPSTNPNAQDANGWTPLLLAVCLRRFCLVDRLLADSRTNPLLANGDWVTPLMMARHNGSTRIAERLFAVA